MLRLGWQNVFALIGLFVSTLTTLGCGHHLSTAPRAMSLNNYNVSKVSTDEQDECQKAEKNPPCPAGQSFNRKTQQCRTCNCESIANSTGNVYPLTVLDTNHCICISKEGFFFDEARHENIACDADGDGWVNSTAKNSVESKDCALRVNARCDVRTIDRFILHNDEKEEPLTVMLDPQKTGHDPLQAIQELTASQIMLYEAEENDTFKVRDNEGLGKPMLPEYHTGGDNTPSVRAQRPEEINSLTKFCGNITNSGGSFDYNGNSMEDLLEWQGSREYLAETAEWQKPFIHYGYYAEIYEGWYEGPKSFREGVGEYHIREKGRKDNFALTNNSSDKSYWRQCIRFRDAAYVTEPDPTKPNRGMDFARFAPITGDPVGGMGHHSQFKCVNIVDDSLYQPSRSNLEKLSVSEAAGRYIVNACHLEESSRKLGPTSVEKNPSDPALVCKAVTPQPGTLALVVAKYQPYNQSNETYSRGCIDECKEKRSFNPDSWCPGMITGNPGARCAADKNDSGKLVCGCGYNYAGKNCGIGCPGNQFHEDPNFNLDTRSGWWFCGGAGNYSALPLTGGGFSLSGGTLETNSSRPPLTGGGFVLK